MRRTSELRRGTFLTALIAVGAAAATARANPRPLPFTYQSETLPAGAVEVEQFVDFVPQRALSSMTGGETTLLATQFQTEFEMGLTDKLELGLYVTFVPQPGEAYASVASMPWGNGAKQRLRYRLADPEAWPVDVALYGEVSENQREIELEAKVILQRRFGALRLITNLWAEHEFYFDGGREWVLNPTLGGTVELTPRWHVGAEGWVRVEYPVGESEPRGFNQGPNAYVGPAVLANLGRLWWTTGLYARVTDAGRETQLGDTFGRVWVRTIIGVGF